jgi:hypothetical protein
MSIDVKHCEGCENDFYNGKNPYGVKECWQRPDARLEPRLLIHVEQAPPYKNLKPQPTPTCYKMKRFVTVKPDAIDAAGYWRSI